MTWQKNISNEDYHRGQHKESFGSSDLKNFMRSPLHCRYAKDNPIKPTPAMIFGTIFHAVVLEPEKVLD